MRFVVITRVIFCTAGLLGCSPQAVNPPVVKMTDAQFDKQHETYTALCANCHGTDWMGGLGGALVGGRWRRGGAPDEIFHSISAGYPDSGMPSFKRALSEADIRQLVDYLYVAGQRHDHAQLRKVEAKTDRVMQAGGEAFQLETVAAGFTTPWSMAWLTDGRMLVTERTGALRSVGLDGQISKPVKGTPEVFAQGQGGLLDVAVHPQHAENGWIYLCFSQPRKQGENTVAFTAIERARLENGQWVASEIVYQVPDAFHTDSQRHWGCKLAFDASNHLHFGIGDRGEGENAQNLAHPAGKIHRINDDGTIPSDNPFVDRPDALPSIWAYGVRNPQGLTLDSNDMLWETEHGPRGGDEFNRIEPGLNYGWALVSRGLNYDFSKPEWKKTAPGMQEALHSWTPSIGTSGLAYYAGDAFASWRGGFLAGGLVGEQLDLIRINDAGSASHETLLKGLGRIRDVRVGPDGFIYLALNYTSRDDADRIVRLRPLGN